MVTGRWHHYYAGKLLRARDGSDFGRITKEHEGYCGLEGCTGHRVSVRWSRGNYTFPCVKGITVDRDGVLRLA